MLVIIFVVIVILFIAVLKVDKKPDSVAIDSIDGQGPADLGEDLSKESNSAYFLKLFVMFLKVSAVGLLILIGIALLLLSMCGIFL